MSDTKHEVEVKFTAKDLTTKVIGNITKAAGGLSSRIDGITSRVAGFAGTFGGLGAVFGFAGSAAGANQYLKTIEELSSVTGQSANKMAGMQHAMERSGVSAEDNKAIMITLAQKQSEILGGSKELEKTAKRYGVVLKKGPQSALISMAEAVEKGRIGTGEVVTLLGESGAKAMDLLRKGGPEVQKLLADGAKKNSHINATSIAQYKRMDVQMTRVKQAWTRITTTVMIKLAPAITKLMAYVERNIDGWTEGAGRFGDLLIEHMDSGIKSARVFGKIMAANYALMKLTGEGILGNANKMMKMSKGAKAAESAGGAGAAADIATSLVGRKKKGAISGRAGVMAKKQSLGGGKILGRFLNKFPNMGLRLLMTFKKIGSFGGKTGKIFGRVAKYAGKTGKLFARIVTGAARLGKVGKILMRFSVIGLLVTAVVVGVQRVLKNVDGIRQKITKLLGGIWDDIKGIGSEIAKLFSSDSKLGMFLQFLGENLLKAVVKILGVIKAITGFVRVVIRMLNEKVGYSTAKAMISMDKAKERVASFDVTLNLIKKLSEYQGKVTLAQVEMFDEAKKGYIEQGGDWKGMIKTQKLGRFAALPESPTERPKVYQDFRGSRFDIMQNFAEGFDPDRIAVAFSNDISSLGERRLQSGLAPVFSAR